MVFCIYAFPSHLEILTDGNLGEKALCCRYKPPHSHQFRDQLLTPWRSSCLHGRPLPGYQSTTASPSNVRLPRGIHLRTTCFWSVERDIRQKNHPPDNLYWVYRLHTRLCACSIVASAPGFQILCRAMYLGTIHSCWRYLCGCLLRRCLQGKSHHGAHDSRWRSRPVVHVAPTDERKVLKYRTRNWSYHLRLYRNLRLEMGVLDCSNDCSHFLGSFVVSSR